jgi:hypothetical protein
MNLYELQNALGMLKSSLVYISGIEDSSLKLLENIYLLQGDIHKQLGSSSLAKDSYLNCIKYAPGSPRANIGLGMLSAPDVGHEALAYFRLAWTSWEKEDEKERNSYWSCESLAAYGKVISSNLWSSLCTAGEREILLMEGERVLLLADQLSATSSTFCNREEILNNLAAIAQWKGDFPLALDTLTRLEALLAPKVKNSLFNLFSLLFNLPPLFPCSLPPFISLTI